MAFLLASTPAAVRRPSAVRDAVHAPQHHMLLRFGPDRAGPAGTVLAPGGEVAAVASGSRTARRGGAVSPVGRFGDTVRRPAAPTVAPSLRRRPSPRPGPPADRPDADRPDADRPDGVSHRGRHATGPVRRRTVPVRCRPAGCRGRRGRRKE
ncbi:hypothetical protein KNE206_43500 [Kitasatospora sp. NE20-6]